MVSIAVIGTASWTVLASVGTVDGDQEEICMNPARPTVRGARAAVLVLAVLAMGACSADPESAEAPQTSAASQDPATGASQDPTATEAPVTSRAPAADGAQGPAAQTPRQLDHSLDGELFTAATDNDITRVQDLIARGADLESRGDDGRTPLVAATKNRATEAALALIEAGADVNAKDDIQDSAYLYAGAEGFDEILEATLRHGADLRSVNRFGGTALIPASEHAHVSTVRMLIAAGVDVNHVNTPQWTALQEAIVYGDGSRPYQETVQALLDAGADPQIRDANGRTALQNAERLGQDAIVALLRR
ncbi:ankyrin repeat domain-containing protein [Nocardia sp. NPDC058176]|uniref:ankyrin repeat domain-containing protein n=1 Tax=Nocardia sp. NPDC058176 TaxID=3346368 RepID=UPI0036D7A64D